MLGILSWSFSHLANCTWPSARHDGSFWHPGDNKRSTFNGKALPFTAFLLEVRGDWAMRKEFVQFSWMARQTRMLPFVHVQTNWNSKLWKLQGIWSFGPFHFVAIHFQFWHWHQWIVFKHQDWQTNNVFGLASHCGLGRGSRFYRQCFFTI